MLERKHIEAIRAWMYGLIHAAQVEIEKHPGNDKSAAGALFYWADGPEKRAALAALAALASCDESQWRSMESAPKDGAHVLLTAGGFVWIAYWVESFGAWTDPDTILGLSENDPTHWMPLPAAPAGEAAEVDD